MADDRYWEPNPLQDTIRDGVRALFQIAYPGKGRVDATGRAVQPDRAAVPLRTLEAEAIRRLPADVLPTGLVPRRPERPPMKGGYNPVPPRYPDWIQGRLMRAWYDARSRARLEGGAIPDTVFSVQPDPDLPLDAQIDPIVSGTPIAPPTMRDTPDAARRGNARSLELRREEMDKPIPRPEPHRPGDDDAHRVLLDDEAPGIGHNDGPPIEGGESDDRLTGDAGDDALGAPSEGTPPEENPWARGEDESLEDFRFRIAKELESKNPDPAKLEELEAALLDGIAREPDAFLLLQGTTPEQLAGMEPEPPPPVAQGVLEEAAANGGIPATGTGASMAYVVGPDGTVYRRGKEGVDRGGLGFMGTLNEIRGQHIAATGKKHADAGDTGALIEHALDIPIPSLGHGEGNRRD
jgi:hypothetical protein